MKLAKFLFVAGTVLILAASGCSGPDSVSAKKRTSQYKAVAASSESLEKVVSTNKVDLDFFHPDHFACLALNVSSIVANKDMADVPWDKVEEQLSEFVGTQNSNLKNIDRIWAVLDRTALDGFTMDPTNREQGAGPWVFVVDFKSEPNTDELDSAIEKMSAEVADVGDETDGDENNDGGEAKKAATALFGLKQIGPTRIAIGKPELIAKIENSNRSTELVRILEARKLTADFEGVLTITPIRSFMKSTMEMMANFGGDAVKKFAAVPDVLEQVDFKLSLDSPEMFEALVHIDDPDLIKNLARAFHEFSDMDLPGVGGGMGGPGGGMFGQQQPTESPVELLSADLIKEVGKEITDSNLFTVEDDEEKIAFRLARPTKFTELLSALIQDGSRQASFAARANRIEKIGNAMKAYHEIHNALPPAGVVKPNAESGLPVQFNWRVGLLPYLGEQESYDSFDFEAAWDSPENQTAAKEMPDVFAFELFSEADNVKTRLHVVGGSIGVYAGDGLNIDEIKDQKTYTALVVEGNKNTAVQWTQPGVLEFAEPAMELVGLEEEKAVLMINAAFNAKAIGKTEVNLRAVLTTDGGESLSRKSYFKIAK